MHSSSPSFHFHFSHTRKVYVAVPTQCYPCLNCQSHLSVLSTLSFFKLHYHQDSLPLGSLHLLNSENHHYTALEFVSDAFCVNDDPFQPSFHLLVISGYTPDKTSKGRAAKNNGMSWLCFVDNELFRRACTCFKADIEKPCTSSWELIIVIHMLIVMGRLIAKKGTRDSQSK